MVVKEVKCYHCKSLSIVKNGKSAQGKQRYLCRDCGQSSTENPNYGYSEERKEEILRAYQERPSMRGISRTFGISRQTLTAWLKKSQDIASS